MARQQRQQRPAASSAPAPAASPAPAVATTQAVVPPKKGKWPFVVGGIVGGLVIISLMFGGSRSTSHDAETPHAQAPVMEIPPGTTRIVPQEVIMPKEVRVTLGTDWYSPAPERKLNVWGYAVKATPPNKTPVWQMQYTYLDNTKSEPIDMDPNDDGGFTWPKNNQPVKVTKYRVKPGQSVDQWEFDFHLDPFSTKS